MTLLGIAFREVEQIRVTLITDGHDSGNRNDITKRCNQMATMYSPNTEKFTSRSTKGDIGTGEVVHGSFREHRIVL
jgi:hypothetical protein